jgi:UDP-glucose 4-epimerase
MKNKRSETVLVTGAAGFIGSHLTDTLLKQGFSVIGIDNLSRGTRSHLCEALIHPCFKFIEMDMADVAALRQVLSSTKVETVWHMVANSDIGAGLADPSIDLRDTFLSTFNLLLVMREAGVKNLAFGSTSAVYGVHSHALREDTGPLFPISNYGAMKLASEAAISAAVESFLNRAWIFRFPNVIGPRATHGILFDLLNKLKVNTDYLEVLGDGTQKKPYLHVSELLEAMLFVQAHSSDRLNCFNIGPEDDGATVLAIAKAIIRTASPHTPIRFTGGDKGWAGDVPKFYYSIEKIKQLGWRPHLTSYDAIERAIGELWGRPSACAERAAPQSSD